MVQRKDKISARRRKKGQGRRIFFGLTSRVLMIFVAVLMSLSYLSFAVNPAQFWLVSLFGLAFLPLLATNIALLIWALLRKSKAFIIPLIAILPCIFFIGRYFQISVYDKMDSTTEDVRMISYNLGRFALSDDDAGVENRGQCADSVFAYLRNQDADIICLQEFYAKKSDAASVRRYVQTYFPDYRAEYYMYYDNNGSFGNLTLSRLPVVNKGVLKFDKSANLAIYTDHKVGERRFRVYNCHFESYNISFTGMVRALFRADGDAFTKTGMKIKNSISRRPKQVDKVFSNIEKCPYEAFVCGDFNDNPMSYTYHRMTKGRKDAFVQAGAGFGATYSHLWPMLRIDYILVPDRFKAIGCDVHKIGFSDHYPVMASIKF